MPKIQKATNGKYEFWVDLGRDPLSGKRRQVHRGGFATKKEAEAEIRRLQNNADNGVVVQKQKANISFAEFALIWHEHYASMSGSKESTIRNKADNIIALNRYIGNAKIGDFNKHTYEQLLIALDKDYAKSSIDVFHTTAGMIFDYAVNCNLLAANPARNAKKPKKAKTLEDVAEDIEDKYLPKDELNRFMSVVKEYGDLQYYALFRLLAYSGMRIGEAQGLETSKVDLNNGTIKIRQTYVNGTTSVKRYQLQTPKTDSSIRDIDLDGKTLEILKRWISEQRRNKMRHRDIWHDDHDFVFTSTTLPGYPLPYYTIRKMFNKFMVVAGLNPNLTLHSLRHTHASLLAESGATLEQIQERLGHENDDITRRIYLHVTKNSKAHMMDQFASYVEQN